MVLANRLGITDSVELFHEEERISKASAMRLYRDGTLDALVPGSLSALTAIHLCLFGDVYPFAGQVRRQNLAKGGFRFVSALYLGVALSAVERMGQADLDQIVDKYVEMNVCHPFREGNGRSMRIWLDQIVRTELGVTVEWSKISRA